MAHPALPHPAQRHKLQGARMAGPQPLPPASMVIQRKVSGLPHAGRIVTTEPGDTTLRIIDGNGELITAVPRDSRGEISRFKAYGRKQPR